MANTSQNTNPARVTFLEGRGDLPMIEITTPWSTAEIYLQGAQVTNFKKQGEPPLLFLSQCSRFEKNQPIRGGIPVIFPWFGAREGLPMHGFARVKPWELKEVLPAADGTVSVRFYLPDSPEAGAYPPFLAEYVVTVNESLTLELIVSNKSTDSPLEFEECFHTYFAVEDISATSVAGLKGTSYLDKVANFAKKTEAEDAIRIESEVDRVYLDTRDTVEIRDARLGRVIRIEKENSASTVVWNPWIAKAQQMPDFGNEEYQKMVCVESGNVNVNKVVLGPGKSSTLKVKLSSGKA
ncbi:MAG TPA: D-hexose-6-phosphate mutarotase [Verrucomicrobiae bacterium]|jgi:D-hexose-6-phosphate mutarotase|nr:D-hexose-6-phosphate mutarotase [Verrucomicrobiae bacterium]